MDNPEPCDLGFHNRSNSFRWAPFLQCLGTESEEGWGSSSAWERIWHPCIESAGQLCLRSSSLSSRLDNTPGHSQYHSPSFSKAFLPILPLHPQFLLSACLPWVLVPGLWPYLFPQAYLSNEGLSRAFSCPSSSCSYHHRLIRPQIYLLTRHSSQTSRHVLASYLSSCVSLQLYDWLPSLNVSCEHSGTRHQNPIRNFPLPRWRIHLLTLSFLTVPSASHGDPWVSSQPDQRRNDP